MAKAIGTGMARFDAEDAAYVIGKLYTGTMPDEFRTRLGAYYTPPALCERLLEVADEAGVDWCSARVLDPACGGGAFLAPVARRMAESRRDDDPATVLKNIQSRLRGFELDAFAAWMSQVFIDATLIDLYTEAGARPRGAVKICDSLEQGPGRRKFDLVVGNPPFRRVTLSPEQRKEFGRSLYGHANLYGVFTDLALRFARRGGIIAYVSPTSFLAGGYFKALRGLLARDAPPRTIDFIEERRGIFEDVLQETLLVTYRRGGDPDSGLIGFISGKPDGTIEKTAGASFKLPDEPDRPWVLPRSEAQSTLLNGVGDLPFRLADYGYSVSTGPLVWNRHKKSLRVKPGTGRYPLIWAESIGADGQFEFRAQRPNRTLYFEPNRKEGWVLTDFPCVLLQRTTAKEQCRRLNAAELPASFIEAHGAVVVENHLNMIRPANGAPKVTPTALTALLNSDFVDQIFRCIGGSVAVSAYELESLPLPSPENMGQLERLVALRVGGDAVETEVRRLYADGVG